MSNCLNMFNIICCCTVSDYTLVVHFHEGYHSINFRSCLNMSTIQSRSYLGNLYKLYTFTALRVTVRDYDRDCDCVCVCGCRVVCVCMYAYICMHIWVCIRALCDSVRTTVFMATCIYVGNAVKDTVCSPRPFNRNGTWMMGFAKDVLRAYVFQKCIL